MNKEIAKNLLKDCLCNNCKNFISISNRISCSIRNTMPKYNTCKKWSNRYDFMEKLTRMAMNMNIKMNFGMGAKDKLYHTRDNSYVSCAKKIFGLWGFRRY